MKDRSTLLGKVVLKKLHSLWLRQSTTIPLQCAQRLSWRHSKNGQSRRSFSCKSVTRVHHEEVYLHCAPKGVIMQKEKSSEWKMILFIIIWNIIAWNTAYDNCLSNYRHFNTMTTHVIQSLKVSSFIWHYFGTDAYTKLIFWYWPFTVWVS